mmetsp:Transcript_110376/g.352095  ORF Transcript_110376/g.352095 Transcript_110376/m.352095 type:complete len:223 (-) Transcript_110376:1525-2193(-)
MGLRDDPDLAPVAPLGWAWTPASAAAKDSGEYPLLVLAVPRPPLVGDPLQPLPGLGGARPGPARRPRAGPDLDDADGAETLVQDLGGLHLAPQELGHLAVAVAPLLHAEGIYGPADLPEVHAPEGQPRIRPVPPCLRQGLGEARAPQDDARQQGAEDGHGREPEPAPGRGDPEDEEAPGGRDRRQRERRQRGRARREQDGDVQCVHAGVYRRLADVGDPSDE